MRADLQTAGTVLVLDRTAEWACQLFRVIPSVRLVSSDNATAAALAYDDIGATHHLLPCMSSPARVARPRSITTWGTHRLVPRYLQWLRRQNASAGDATQ